MNFSSSSQSRSKISHEKKQGCLPSVEVLHNRLRRRVAPQQYKSIYPRLKISDKSRVNTLTILQNEFSQENIHQEVMKMKEENRKLEQENEMLRTGIRRATKLDDLFERRRENEELSDMQFQKLVELKLLLEAEELEGEYTQCEKRFKETQKQYKNLKNSIDNDCFQSQKNFINLLAEVGFDTTEMRNKNELKLKNLNDQLLRIRLKTRKLKQQLKARKQEYNSLSEQVEAQRKKLPDKFDTNLSVSESGVMGLQLRNKPIHEIESEIAKLKEETQQLEEYMQKQIDGYVQTKIILYKEIDEFQTSIKERTYNNGKAITNL